MKSLIAAAVAVASLAAVAALAAAGATTSTTSVAITHAGFVPKSITIQQGDSVTWSNADTSNHQVISQSAGFSSPVLKPNDTYSHTFTKAGIFQYKDAFSSFTGDITVTPAPLGNVSAHSSVGTLTYGGRAALSGTVSNGQSGEQVTVYAQECGKSSASQDKVASTTTGTNGDYTVNVQPLLRTDYTVQWGTASSDPVTLHVRPQLTLGRVTPTHWTVRARAGGSLAGRMVTVERLARPFHWRIVRYATLRANSTGVAPTVVSSVTFTLKVPRRTHVRVVLGARQAAPCFSSAISNVAIR